MVGKTLTSDERRSSTMNPGRPQPDEMNPNVSFGRCCVFASVRFVSSQTLSNHRVFAALLLSGMLLPVCAQLSIRSRQAGGSQASRFRIGASSTPPQKTPRLSRITQPPIANATALRHPLQNSVDTAQLHINAIEAQSPNCRGSIRLRNAWQGQ